MKINYIVLTKEEIKKVNKQTVESIKNILTKEDTYSIVKFTNNDLDDKYFTINEIKEEYDYTCLIPDGSTLNNNYRILIEEYFDGNKKIYLPLVLITTNGETKGVLNSCVYSPSAFEPGLLDFQLASMQIDTTLFGALIPTEFLLEKKNFHEQIKFYQHFYFLNVITAKNNEVRGIPKLLVNLDYDLSYNSYSKEEKMSNYKLAHIDLEVETEIETVNG